MTWRSFCAPHPACSSTRQRCPTWTSQRSPRNCTRTEISSSALEGLNTISKLVGERGFLPESVAASNGVSVFAEKRITVVSVGDFQQEFRQNALQRIMRKPSADESHGHEFEKETSCRMVYCFRFGLLSPWRSVVIHLFKDVVWSTQCTSVADHFHTEQSKLVANPFQHDH